uniref:Polyprotein n=1 Tax=Cajanus cajan TaxID=3821 RepID=A0A151SPE1_CAJCA|nr:Putative polyprotein [Cajanus cajan]
MIYNYKRLNDNTHIDGYTIPSKDALINRIQKAKWFSKFDLKSGFHQVRMHPDSIKWTAFSCSEGLFEWQVMPFDLKNARKIFQRKMDNIFGQYKYFTCTYIDDVLVFSKTKEEHFLHSKQVLYLFEKYGLIISKSKMEICKTRISFLRTEIGNGKIKLQLNISQKILVFPDKMEDIKALRAFLGLLNYARNFIKNLGKYTTSLYNKTSLSGQRKSNTEDIKLVKQIKEMVKNLPSLSLPLDTDYLFIECDGCELGWGAILKKKKNKYDNISEEQICRYASRKYHTKSQIYSTSTDYEVNVVINGLKTFELFLINKSEITIRTDCEAIVAYGNSQINSDKKPHKRWLLFQEYVYHNGIKINFEHIKGNKNIAADILSRFAGMINNETFKGFVSRCEAENEVW